MKAFLAFLKIDLKLARRNRAVLFFNYFFPLMFFFVFGYAFDAKQGSTSVIVVGDAKKFLPALQKEFSQVEVIPAAELDLNSAKLRRASKN